MRLPKIVVGDRKGDVMRTMIALVIRWALVCQLTLCLPAAAAMAAAPEPCDGNLLVDGGFESEEAYQHWSVGASGDPRNYICTAERCETDGARTGDGWLRFYGRVTDDVLAVGQQITGHEDTTLMLEFYVHVTSPEATGWLMIEVDGMLRDGLSFGGVYTDGYHHVSMRLIELPLEPFVLTIANPSLGGGDVHIDDVCLSPCTDERYRIHLENDRDGDHLSDDEEDALGWNADNPDEDDNGVWDGVQLALVLAGQIAAMNRYEAYPVYIGEEMGLMLPPDVEEILPREQPYTLYVDYMLDCLWSTDACHAPVTIGHLQVVNPLLHASWRDGLEIPLDGWHYLQHGSFSYASDGCSDHPRRGRIDPVALKYLVEFSGAEGEGEGAAEGEGEGEGEGQPPFTHSADQDGDGMIRLGELLRVIQFYNSGGYSCALTPGATEDGYAPGIDGHKVCAPHASDYNPQDWIINLSELLRAIQFYNSDGYRPCVDGEDGYCPRGA